MTPLVLGQKAFVTGDVTTNNRVGARSARDLETSLGFGPGRLSAGWWILLLKQRLTPADFVFSGLTIRSGGRLGLPKDDPAIDKLRPHVHDKMLKQYGLADVTAMQERFLRTATYEGPERLVKVIPVTPHSPAMAPSEQYPMGGGGLQWTLVKPCEFLVAVRVDENAIAYTPHFTVFLGESAGYDERAKLKRYMDAA